MNLENQGVFLARWWPQEMAAKRNANRETPNRIRPVGNPVVLENYR